MSTITSLVGTDGITTANSMTKINTNFTNLNTDKFEKTDVDTDTTLAANSDVKVPSQKAIKAYVDALGNINPPCCRVYQTAATTLTTTQVEYVLDFGGESFDTDTMHSTVSNTSRITFTTAGTYLIGGSIHISTNNVDVRISIRVDGTTTIGTSGYTGNNGTNHGSSISTLYQFTAGQYIEFLGSSVANGQSTSGDLKTNAWAVRVSD